MLRAYALLLGACWRLLRPRLLLVMGEEDHVKKRTWVKKAKLLQDETRGVKASVAQTASEKGPDLQRTSEALVAVMNNMSFLFAVLVGSTSALTLPTASTNQAHGIASRRSFLANGASAALAVAAVAGGAAQPAFAEDLGDGLTYTVVTKGKGSGQPKIGDLIVVRFKSTVVKSGQVIDDIMANPEGYYYRVGSGQVLPCVEKAVVQMKTGDVWRMTVPPELGFGKAGRSARCARTPFSSSACNRPDFVHHRIALTMFMSPVAALASRAFLAMPFLTLRSSLLPCPVRTTRSSSSTMWTSTRSKSGTCSWGRAETMSAHDHIRTGPAARSQHKRRACYGGRARA